MPLKPLDFADILFLSWLGGNFLFLMGWVWTMEFASRATKSALRTVDIEDVYRRQTPESRRLYKAAGGVGLLWKAFNVIAIVAIFVAAFARP